MKFALYDFFEEELLEVGLSEFIEGKSTAECTNESWSFADEVFVLWPKHGKKGNTITRCVARVKKFSGTRFLYIYPANTVKWVPCGTRLSCQTDPARETRRDPPNFCPPNFCPPNFPSFSSVRT